MNRVKIVIWHEVKINKKDFINNREKSERKKEDNSAKIVIQNYLNAKQGEVHKNKPIPVVLILSLRELLVGVCPNSLQRKELGLIENENYEPVGLIPLLNEI